MSTDVSRHSRALVAALILAAAIFLIPFAGSARADVPLGSILAIPGEAQGGDTVAIRPQLTAAAPAGGELVTLSTDSPSLLPIDGTTVLVPEGEFGAVVDVTTGVVSTTTTVTLSASFDGASVSNTLQLDPPATLTSVGFSPSTTFGTQGATGGVTISAEAPPDGLTVALSSSDPAHAAVPPTAEVGGFGQAAGFDVTTTPVTADETVTITATLNGTTVSGTLLLTPPPPPTPAISALSVGAGSVAAGGSVAGSVTLNTPAPAGGSVVSLFSSASSTASVPASVTVAPGTSTANFTIKAGNVQATTTVSIGATFNHVLPTARLFTVTGGKGGAALAPVPAGTFLDPGFLTDVARGTQNVNDFITWDGSLESFSLAVSSGVIPPGFTLEPFHALSYVITGSPTTSGTYAFVLKLTAADGSTFGQPYVWTVGPPAPLRVDFANVPNGTVGQQYGGGYAFGGGVPPYKWTITAGKLPDGVSLDSTSGQFSGKAQKAGTFSFTATLTDNNKSSVSEPETVVISAS